MRTRASRATLRSAGAGAVFVSALLAGCGTTITSTLDEVLLQVIGETPFASSLEINLGDFTKLESGVYIQDLIEGDGPSAVVGTSAKLLYTGWLANGTEFDSGTFTFALGAREVIVGFEQGMMGMKAGGVRRIIIPPALAYGSRGSGPVPGGAIVVFRVELESVS